MESRKKPDFVVTMDGAASPGALTVETFAFLLTAHESTERYFAEMRKLRAPAGWESTD